MANGFKKISINSCFFLPLLFHLVPSVNAADSASLQFTVPAPDPVMAGDVVSFQSVGINSGTEPWPKGSYFWNAEIYDMDYHYLAKTEEVSADADVPPGGVSASVLKLQIPDTYLGRKFFRVFLTHDGRRLIESEYKPFQITEKQLPPPPPPEKYKVSGDMSFTYKNSDLREWKDHNGVTNANIVGKIGESSFLFNGYLLHSDSRLVDPYILVLNYYAPWGVINAGDISPSVSPLSLQGQGMRGGSLEQDKGRYSWMVFGGRTVSVLAGNPVAGTNGRFERYLFGVKTQAAISSKIKLSADYTMGTDDPNSLSSDPHSGKYRGPTLTPQKNPVYGLTLDCLLNPGLSLLLDYQKSEFYKDTDSADGPAIDSAWRGEVKWQRNLFKARGAAQRTGSGFVSFGSPGAVPDRMTYEGDLSVYPAEWLSLSALFNRYNDNLSGDPGKTTTNQNQMTFGNTLSLPSGGMMNMSYSINSAKGEPRAVQDNKTTVFGAGLSQPFKGHVVSAGWQISKFTDNTGLSHGLDSNMISLNGVFNLRTGLAVSAGFVNSTAKDAVNSSSSKNNSYTASAVYSMPARRLSLQVWTTVSTSLNDSPVFPADSRSLAVNTELTWAKDKQTNLTFGVGRNDVEDKFHSEKNLKEITMLVRYNYSF